MQLGRLAALERRKVQEELAEVKHHRETANDPGQHRRGRAFIKADLAELKEKYGDPRRTEIVDAEAADFTEEDLIPNDEVVVTLTANGYIKRLATGAYRAQRRGGKGSRGMTTHEDDDVAHLLVTHAHDSLLFFTDRGTCISSSLCVARRGPRRQGRPPAQPDQYRAGGVDYCARRVPKFVARDYMVVATKRGEVKKTSLDEFAVVRSLGLIAMDLEPGDELIGARLVGANDQVMLITERRRPYASRWRSCAPHRA